MKHIRVPFELVKPPFSHRELSINGFSIVESCTHTTSSRGSMFLEEHMLLYVREGQNIMTHGKVAYTVKQNEMLLLNKATLVEYHKTGDPQKNNGYDSLLFFLKDDFLQEFIRMSAIKYESSKEVVKIGVKPVKPRLRAFFESVIPYFEEPGQIEKGLLKLKMLELLYDLTAADKNLLQQLLQMKKPVKADITEVMEANFSNPVNIEQLAYLSGRSLASFKREFSRIYNMPPSEWIRLQRLNKAKETLENTNMSVTDVCYMLGFENLSHFSRIFKAHFGYSPASNRTLLAS